MDGIPISEALARCDVRFARTWWHWFFLAQPEIPERVILADPDAWYSAGPGGMGEESHRESREATHDPRTVRAMVEDYRAGLGIDLEHELWEDVAEISVTTPSGLVVTALTGVVGELARDRPPRPMWVPHGRPPQPPRDRRRAPRRGGR